MSHSTWIAILEASAARFGAVICADLAALMLAELWGVHGLLRTMAAQGG